MQSSSSSRQAATASRGKRKPTHTRVHARTPTVIILCIHIDSISVLQFFLMSCKYEQSVQQNKMTWLASMPRLYSYIHTCMHRSLFGPEAAEVGLYCLSWDDISYLSPDMVM